MKSDRLLSALLLLQAHGRMTGRALAERLEVSQRTMHRDMEALSAAGVPVTALRGAQGGWQLEKGWRTQVPGLDAAELRALLMAQPRALSEPRLAAAAERALGKLMASLPGSMREQAIAMRERLHVDANDWRPVSEDLSMLPAVQDAVARDCRLSFDYTRADGERGPRVVDPLGPGCEGNELVSGGAYATRHADIPRLAYARCYATSYRIPAACAFRSGKALEKVRQRTGSPAATLQSYAAFVSAGRGIADSLVCCNTGSNTGLKGCSGGMDRDAMLILRAKSRRCLWRWEWEFARGCWSPPRCSTASQAEAMIMAEVAERARQSREEDTSPVP